MQEILHTDNLKMALYITIKCKGKKNFRVWAEDKGKINSKYADRIISVEGERTIYFSFPITPKQMFIGCLNANDPNDHDFEVTLKEGNLKTYNIHMDSATDKFVQLAMNFCQVCGFERPAPQGTFYQTADEYYRIKYLPVIKDVMSGQVMTTPARIGHNTGIIEISAVKYVRYTFAMRMMIILHEFSHKYKNPKMNLEINNEVGADINALYIYLGLGFSKVDAICVYANIFLKANTEQNIQRMRKIMNYIQKFENQEFARLN